MNLQAKRVGRAGSSVAFLALSMAAAIPGAPPAGAAGTASALARQPNCSWPVSSRQIDATLGIKVQNPTSALTEPLAVAGKTARFTMCIYYGVGAEPIGDVVVEYFGGVGSIQEFDALESGVVKSKHLGHMAVVPGIGSAAFTASTSSATYVIAHVGTTMFLVFALRPRPKVVVLARTIARVL